jgi:hypothetical protein
VTTKDDRTDIFGIPYEPPKRAVASISGARCRSSTSSSGTAWSSRCSRASVGPSHLRARGALVSSVREPAERRHPDPSIWRGAWPGWGYSLVLSLKSTA